MIAHHGKEIGRSFETLVICTNTGSIYVVSSERKHVELASDGTIVNTEALILKAFQTGADGKTFNVLTGEKRTLKSIGEFL